MICNGFFKKGESLEKTRNSNKCLFADGSKAALCYWIQKGNDYIE